MKTLYFDYDMQIRYAEPVGRCHFTIRCVPPRTSRQCPEEFRIKIEPVVHSEQGEDSFGNRLLFGRVDEPHRLFSLHAEGRVSAGMAEYEEAEREERTGMYRYPYGLTVPGDKLKAYFRQIETKCGRDARQRGIVLMNRLYQDFSYEKNVTGVGTSAEEAFGGGRGVCQDYAHIMIALCRMAGIPARYVTGMLVGEGSSHAWVEVLSAGKWYGLDPTNNLIVGEEHIKIGTGRDASDCPINRGLLFGGGEQVQIVSVKVRQEKET